jgi:murein DD-endopeptidase MepM/ murein hydrolase activator NlpD
MVAIAVLAGTALLIPRAAAQVQDEPGRGEAPCPGVEPSPTPTPTPTESPAPTESPTPEATPSPTPSPSPDDCPEPEPEPDPEPKPDEPKGDKDDKGDEDDGKKDGKKNSKKDDKNKNENRNKDHDGTKNKKRGARRDEPAFLEVADSYDTSVLVAVAAHLRALGWSSDEVAARVFAPFIVAGKANWIDTWGAPRFGPGLLVRTHEGQDVFCEYGDPVQAVENGTIEYDEIGLGGIIARLHLKDGGYWYYAHLSKVNDKVIPSGSRVGPGDVIGFCGNTGNAITTPPHVHFGFYTESGVAKDPMRMLIRWLRTAERHATLVLARVQGGRVARIDTFRSARLFGDSFAPDLSPDSTTDSVLASATSASSNFIGFAQAALLAAFEAVPDEGAGSAAGTFERSTVRTRAHPAAGD